MVAFLDGGGIRGLSEILTLQDIMTTIKEREHLPSVPEPWQYFDLIGGTSTGGIIALMLGRLKMPLKEVEKVYIEFGKHIFSCKKTFGEGKFKTSVFEERIKEIVKRVTTDHNPDTLMKDEDHVGPKTFVCALPAANMELPRLFRTYKSQEVDSFNCKIWEAARATSAAPTFFKPMAIGLDGAKEEFIDGGLGFNNPTELAITEAKEQFPNMPISCIVSLGSGKPPPIGLPKAGIIERYFPLNTVHALRATTLDTERVAVRVGSQSGRAGFRFFRFNVEKGLENVGMDQWKKTSEIITHTVTYLSNEQRRVEMTAVAEILTQSPVYSMEQPSLVDPVPVYQY
ncbi:FabD/lysophospholipase-like protein [Sistotremastrum niveocremeum HHB9708]|uniref:FabD/lysophospholipase-like protein n=1 Tax=Sistotremastrum niveocremeum HHB9708 TaxID=1314777 RepID=A0A164NYR3_9AGAM|nr:FabD/lysophospholipase-like protein [Sistotremastrum niveocremeum HHB9708]